MKTARGQSVTGERKAGRGRKSNMSAPGAGRTATPSAQPAASGEPPRGVGIARVALIVFVVALALRTLHIWQIRTTPFFTALMGDARGYDEWAQRIAGGDWFGSEVFYQ